MLRNSKRGWRLKPINYGFSGSKIWSFDHSLICSLVWLHTHYYHLLSFHHFLTLSSLNHSHLSQLLPILSLKKWPRYNVGLTPIIGLNITCIIWSHYLLSNLDLTVLFVSWFFFFFRYFSVIYLLLRSHIFVNFIVHF